MWIFIVGGVCGVGLVAAVVVAVLVHQNRRKRAANRQLRRPSRAAMNDIDDKVSMTLSPLAAAATTASADTLLKAGIFTSVRTPSATVSGAQAGSARTADVTAQVEAKSIARKKDKVQLKPEASSTRANASMQFYQAHNMARAVTRNVKRQGNVHRASLSSHTTDDDSEGNRVSVNPLHVPQSGASGASAVV